MARWKRGAALLARQEDQNRRPGSNRRRPCSGRTRFWKGVLRRGAHRIKQANAFDVAFGTGFTRGRHCGGESGRDQRHPFPLILLLCLLILCAGGCHRAGKPDLDTVYRTSVQELRSGDLKSAMGGVDHALGQVPNFSSDWYWRLTALKAEILIWEGMNKESLALLHQDLPPSLQTSDTTIWRR